MPLKFDDSPPPSLEHVDRRAVRGVALAALLALLAMSWPALVGREWIADDLGAFHLPMRQFYQECLQADRPFDWMPSLFGGFYATGEGQTGGYHPLRRLVYRALPLQGAFAVEVGSAYLLLFGGTLYWLRPLVERRSSAWLGAFFLTFGSFLANRFVHPNAVAVTAHLPWLLALTRRPDDPEAARRRWAWIALATGSQILSGYPQYVWFSVLVETWLAVGSLGRAPWNWAGWASAKACGAALGAVQILPTWDLLGEAQRNLASAEFFQRGAFAPVFWLQCLAPWAEPVQHELGYTPGCVPLALLLLVGAARATSSGADRSLERRCWLLAGFATVLALGRWGGVQPLLQALPVIGSFRMPVRYLIVTHVALTPLVARRFDRLFESAGGLQVGGAAEDSNPAARDWAGPALIVASGLAAGAAWLIWPATSAASRWLLLAGPLGFAAAVWAIRAAGRRPQLALPLLAALAGAETLIYGAAFGNWNRTAPAGEPTGIAPPPAAVADWPRLALQIDTLATNRQAKYVGDQLIRSGWRLIDGYAGLPPASRLFGDGATVEALQVGGVGWVLSRHVPEGFEGLGPERNGWRESPAPLPRFRLVAETHVSPTPREDLRRFDPRGVVLLDRPLDAPLQASLASDPQARVDRLSDEPGRIELHVRSRTTQVLVVSERYHAGWRAWIDGRPQAARRAYGDFQAYVVPAGDSSVILEFQPASLKNGRRISWAALALVGLVLLWPARDGRRAVTGEPGEARVT